MLTWRVMQEQSKRQGQSLSLRLGTTVIPSRRGAKESSLLLEIRRQIALNKNLGGVLIHLPRIFAARRDGPSAESAPPERRGIGVA